MTPFWNLTTCHTPIPLDIVGGVNVWMEERIPRKNKPKKLSHSSNRHPRNAFAEFNNLRKMKNLCDIVLNAGTKRIFAHKVVLCACSPYFKAMFTSGLAESRQGEVTLKDIDGNALEAIIDYCYTSRIIVDECNVQMLLPAACLLQMTEIQNICCEFLHQQLDASNCLGIRAFADIHSCFDLQNLADKFIRDHFEHVVACEEFLSVSVDQLENIISKDELNVFHEEQILDAVILWVRNDVCNREQHLFRILRHVRLHLINSVIVAEKIGYDTLIKSNELCRDLVEKAKNYRLMPVRTSKLQGPRIRPRTISKRDRRLQTKRFLSRVLLSF